MSDSDTITIDEYMVSPLPHPQYDNPVQRPNTSGSTWRRPTHLSLWADFRESVISWIDSHHQLHSKQVERPVFISRVITEEVSDLQPFILDNLLQVSAKCFIPPSHFKRRRQIPSCIGEPDHLMVRNGEIVAVIEDKGNWTLRSGDIVNEYNSSRTSASAVNQLYQYLRLNHRTYGVITSYDHTWFVYRSQQCSICDESEGHETLYVSEGIPYTAQNPSVLQCFAYFNSIVNHNHMDSPPTSKRSSRASSATRLSRAASATFQSGSFRGTSGLLHEIQINDQAHDFDVDDFKLNTVLGEGRSKVYLDHYESQPIALKTADIAKHPEMLPELQNEVSVYEELSELQGKAIPRLVCHGYVEAVLYCVGLSVCGTVPKKLTEQQKQRLLDILESIHQIGILHNDIREENILVDESGNPFIIDFGFATRSSLVADQLEERDLLQRLIENM
jgi:predicted Ser/Thr protein kinase